MFVIQIRNKLKLVLIGLSFVQIMLNFVHILIRNVQMIVMLMVNVWKMVDVIVIIFILERSVRQN